MPGEVRMLTSRSLPEIRRLLDQDPIAHCFVESRVSDTSSSYRFGGELWGWVVDGRLESMLYSGANMIPVATTPLARANFAERSRQYGRRCSSLVGPADEVMDLWRLLGPAWGPARELRPVQHVMATAQPPEVAPDPRTRPLRMDELPLLVPAAIAMFTEEVGVSPQANGGGPAYRARLAEIVRAGRSLAIVSEGRICFKAEIGSVTPRCCQVQGVWVAPEFRGTGLGKAGMAAVVAHAQANVAPIVSLYVNDFNTRAVATYLRVGFRHVGTFATILF